MLSFKNVSNLVKKNRGRKDTDMLSGSRAKMFRGFPVPDSRWCFGCEACSMACPANAITIQDDRAAGIRKIHRLHYRCIQCGSCERICPAKMPGVVLSDSDMPYGAEKTELKTVQEFNLVVCEQCGAKMGTTDQYERLFEDLGPGPIFSSIDMILERAGTLVGDIKILKKKSLKSGRQTIFRRLCQKCRHAAYQQEKNR